MSINIDLEKKSMCVLIVCLRLDVECEHGSGEIPTGL